VAPAAAPGLAAAVSVTGGGSDGSGGGIGGVPGGGEGCGAWVYILFPGVRFADLGSQLLVPLGLFHKTILNPAPGRCFR
jgi:hypothetical protein